jgi:hypothetical protein
MLDEGKLDLIIAFPGHRETANMIKPSERRGLEIITVDDTGGF